MQIKICLSTQKRAFGEALSNELLFGEVIDTNKSILAIAIKVNWKLRFAFFDFDSVTKRVTKTHERAPNKTISRRTVIPAKRCA